MTVLGVIGGSGVYALDALEDARWEKVESPFGAPSDALLRGRLHGVETVFLPRHGRGHRIPPSQIDYRANIDALKRAGVTDLVSVSACGSLREELAPGTFVLVDQFVDRTVARASSFFGAGLVAHVSMADPVCARLGDALEATARAQGIALHRGGTYLAMEGPQFSSRAESRALPRLGLRRDRHDQHARGEARPRGGALLRERRHGHRLRLLAPARGGRGGRRHRGPARAQRRAGARAGRRRWRRGCAAARRRARSGCDRALDGAIITRGVGARPGAGPAPRRGRGPRARRGS